MMEDFQSYQRDMGPRPGNKKIALNIWNSVWPPLLYIGAQLLIGIAAGIIIVFLASSGGFGLSSGLPESEVSDLIYRMSMPVMGISMAVCLAFFVPFYIKWKKDEQRHTGFLAIGAGNIALILLLAVSSYFAVGYIISLFPENFGGYNEVIETLTAGSFVMQLLVVGFGAPLVEELCLRGLCQGRLSRIMPVGWAIFLQALIFGVLHGNIVQGLYAFLLGILLGWLYWRSRSLWAPFFLHFFFNTGNVILSELWQGGAVEEVEEALPRSVEIIGLLFWIVIALAATFGLIYALNRTLPGGKKREKPVQPLPWEI